MMRDITHYSMVEFTHCLTFDFSKYQKYRGNTNFVNRQKLFGKKNVHK
jgi:hypothetical protein